jgi:hypothetical protein
MTPAIVVVDTAPRPGSNIPSFPSGFLICFGFFNVDSLGSSTGAECAAQGSFSELPLGLAMFDPNAPAL